MGKNEYSSEQMGKKRLFFQLLSKNLSENTVSSA
jgi:hypothetical protein